MVPRNCKALALIVAALLVLWSASATSQAKDDKPTTMTGGAHTMELMQRSADLYKRGDLDGAIRVLRKGVAQEPSEAQLHFMLANAYFRKGMWQVAAGEYEKSAKLRPNHPDTYLNLGFAYFRAGYTDRAVVAWREALRQSPNDALTHASLAMGLLGQGQAEEARKLMGKAMSMDREWRRHAAVDVRWSPRMVREADRLITIVMTAQ